MCTICASVRPFEPECAYEVINATILEGVDAPANISTPYTIQVGDIFQGSLGFVGDRDWVRIELQAGQTYDISLAASGSGRGTLSDAFLRVYSSTGVFLEENDDISSSNRDSRLPTFTASYSGFFYLEAASYLDGHTGTYELSVTGGGGGGSGPVNPTLIDNMANYLTHGYWAFNGAPARAFDTSSSNIITVDITSLTAEGQQLARWAMQAWEMVANIRFSQVNSDAQITFRDNEDGAFAFMQFSNPSSFGGIGRISSATINVSTDWLVRSGSTLDSYSFQTYIHEIGHALGLGHQGRYNNTATFNSPDRVFDLDSWQLSVMSYFSQEQNTLTNASQAFIQSAMMSDLTAIQTLYGAPGANSATAGATIWGTGSNLGNYLVHSFNALLHGTTRAGVIGNDPVALTIYDVGGFDLINLTGSTLGHRLDLTPGSFSDISGGRENLGIHLNTWIENAFGGSGNDTIQGNNANNLINGGGGNDLIRSGGGRNVLYGGAGNDTIHAGGGDTVLGGTGTDTLVINPGLTVASVIFTREQVNGDGTTTRDGAITFTNGQRLTFIDIENLPGGLPAPTAGNPNTLFTGTMGANVLVGGTGNDTLNALAGDDLLMATGGNNVMWGGRGNDTIWGAGGNDTVGGGFGDDLIYGVAGNNMLWGSEGHDTVIGGTGNDTVGGGTGNDLLFGFSGRNQLWGGRGNDTVYAGDGGDSLGGNAGDDLLIGGVGNDTLYGGAGSDTLYGGAGNDVFVFYRQYDYNRVMDFGGGDRLELAQGLWRGQGNLSVQQVIDRFAQVNGSGNIVLDFGDASTVIELVGFGNLGALANQIDII